MKYLLLLLPLAANASELQLACNLERSKAEVRAATLAAPAAIASVGQDAVSGEKALIVGISQSLSGRKQANLIRDSAEAKCDALHSTLQLDEHARWSQLQVQRASMLVELKLVEQAILLAKENIAQLDAQLTAQTITISQHTEARQSMVALEARQAEILRSLSVVSAPPPNTNIANLLASSRQHEANSARLAAQAQAETGWDVVISAGARQPQNGSAAPYATIGLRYSFGAPAAAAAARDVGRNTELLLAAQQGGYTQTVLRQRDTLKALVQAETLASSTAARQITHLKRVRASMVGIDTALALNTIRSLDLQLLILQAEASGAETRLAGYNALVLKLE
jgi:hypothetical protein